MPKLSYRAPKYAFHKASGQAVVRINSKLVYLGPWGSRESKDRYKQAVTRWADDQDRSAAVNTAVAKTLPESSTMLVELIAEYLDHADAYYRKNGQPTGTAANLRPILRRLKELFGALLVADFRPSHLDAFQGRMIQNGASRRYINDACSRVKTMFKWGVAKDLVPVATWQGLLAVRGLAKGRSKARETKPVLPVADEVVHATLPFLPPVVQDMVQFERLTGVRPGEVCTLRPCDVDRSGGDVWLYRPASHKCEHHDRGRVIAIGPIGSTKASRRQQRVALRDRFLTKVGKLVEVHRGAAG